ncbi:MAG: efflux RND transporter periplasmic adaptor subunit [Anaerolineae bacterium]|nr:efflux RND transporter periplasmic adaptor subunit [Anaerolineae bacterium]
MNKKLFATLLGLLLVVTLSACAGVGENGNNASFEASGTIAAREANVAAELSGRVMETWVDEGAAVAAGDALFALEDTVLQAQRDQSLAAVEAARTTVEAARAQATYARLQVELALQGARLQEQAGRAATWTVPTRAEFAQPAWYFRRAETISASVVELAEAHDALQIELANLTAVLEAASNADLIAAETRLAEAQAAFLVAQQTLTQSRGITDVETVAQEQFDAAKTAVDAAQTNYDRILSSAAASDVWEARARAAVAQARYDNARDRLDMLQTGEQSLQVEVARASLHLAETNVTQAEANLAQAEAALAVLDATLAKTTVYAPIDGVVLARHLEVGEIVAAGSTVLVIGQLDEVKVTVYIGETSYGQVNLGQAARVTVDSFPREEFAGTVTHIADQAEFTPRNVQTQDSRRSTVYAVDIRVPNPDHKLKPGMPADVSIDR